MPISRGYDHFIACPRSHKDHISYAAAFFLLQQILRLSLEDLIYLGVADISSGDGRVIMSRGLDVFRAEHAWRNDCDVVPQIVLNDLLVIRLAQ